MWPFRKQDKANAPINIFVDESLGQMVWRQDDEAWAGEMDGLRFLIGYDRQPVPKEELLSYARQILSDPRTLNATIDQAGRIEADKSPQLANEIAGLTVETIFFYTHKGVRRIILDLSGGKNDRCWRAEFKENTCEGIGFDT